MINGHFIFDSRFLKGSVSRDFRPLFFVHDSNPSEKPDKQAWAFSKSVSISLRYSITKFEKFDSGRMHVAHWLRNGMHTAEHDSAIWCNPRSLRLSFLKIRISRRNRNRIRKYISLFIRGLDGFESWKNVGWKSCDTLPLSWPKVLLVLLKMFFLFTSLSLCICFFSWSYFLSLVFFFTFVRVLAFSLHLLSVFSFSTCLCHLFPAYPIYLLAFLCFFLLIF